MTIMYRILTSTFNKYSIRELNFILYLKKFNPHFGMQTLRCLLYRIYKAIRLRLICVIQEPQQKSNPSRQICCSTTERM